MTQEQFSKLFLRTLSQYDVSAIPVSADSVTAGDMDRMRRRHIRHLIVLGASDDTLPDVRSGDGILSADEREELAGLGVSLGGGVDALSRELSLIYNCVTLPSETLTISYSAFDGNGGQLRPSFLIRRAKQLFGLREEVLDLSETRLSAPGPAFLLAAASLSGAGGAGAKKARAYFSETWEGGQSLSALTERAKNRRGSLSGEAVRALYGETLRLSPSRVDSFSSCRFAYFLKFGLKLSENERAGFEAPELGSFMEARGEEPLSASGGTGSAVRILSIHKAKGLEFPVVFLANTSRRFNTADLRASVLIHPVLGLGCKVTDTRRGLEYPTLARRAIASRLTSELLSEEMRVLYVAMTRAKERLYLSCTAGDPEALIAKLSQNLTSPISPELLKSMKSANADL